MVEDTRHRFLAAALTTAAEHGLTRSVRTVASAAHATPSLLYRYFGSVEELDAEARVLGIATVLGDEVGHGHLVELLGGVAGLDPMIDPVAYAPTYVENGLFSQLHVAWLRRNRLFVTWLFGGKDFPDAFEQVRPGLVQEFFLQDPSMRPETAMLALKVVSAWVCHSANCSDEELPDVLRWAGHTVDSVVRVPDAGGLAVTLSEAVDQIRIDGLSIKL